MLSAGQSQGVSSETRRERSPRKPPAGGLLRDSYTQGPPSTSIMFLIRGCCFHKPQTKDSLFLSSNQAPAKVPAPHGSCSVVVLGWDLSCPAAGRRLAAQRMTLPCCPRGWSSLAALSAPWYTLPRAVQSAKLWSVLGLMGEFLEVHPEGINRLKMVLLSKCSC